MARATIFKILQKEEFAEAMKSLKAEKETPKKIRNLQSLALVDQQGLICVQGRKNQLNFKTKHPALLHWKHHVVELFLQKEHRIVITKALNMSEI